MTFLNIPKRRACMVTTGHRALDTRVFDRQARSLARAGYQVTVIGQHDVEEARDGVRIIPLPRATGWMQRMLNGWRAGCLARRVRAELYHFHDPELLPVGVLLKLLGGRVIYDVHEDYQQTVLASGRVPRLLRRIVSVLWGVFERAGSTFLDGIVVVDSHLQRKFPFRKTVLITNVPPLSFLTHGERPKRDGVFRLVYTGVVDEDRGISKILAALDHLGRKNVELHVFGDVPTPELKDLLASYPQVVCHGRVPWLQLRTEMAATDAGTLLLQPTPAHLTFTGEGNTKLFEFMALGLPIIYSDFTKLRALVDSLGAGIAVDPTDPRRIADAIGQLREDHTLCRRLGENGRKAVRERYHWECEERKLLALYERLLGGSGPSRRP